MSEITNVELILLSLLAETETSSGYGLDTIVRQRGVRQWADIGSTSIYVGLKKLKSKGYVISCLDRKKKGRGPRGVVVRITVS